jgi:aminocarboxymuconate-semialdehyde decarboxylase
LDLAAAVARLGTEGIDIALVSPWVDLLGAGLNPDVSKSWARFFNESMLEATAGEPRLIPLAAIPAQSPKAGEEMEWARSAGFVGGSIGTTAVDSEFDDKAFEPMWEAANDLQFPLFMHPSFHGKDARLADGRTYGVANSVGRANDTTITLSRLVLAGVLHRYPKLAIVAAHGGGALPYLVGRLNKVRELNPDVLDPYVAYRRLYFDSVVLDRDTLRFLAATAGVSQVMLGSDYPFPNGDPFARKLITSAQFSPEEESAILGGNAERVFRL